MTTVAVQRELPLAIARCCTAYVVSMQHAVPACGNCGMTPAYERDTLWYLGLDDE